MASPPRYIRLYGEIVPAWTKELLVAWMNPSDTSDSEQDEPCPVCLEPPKKSLRERRGMPPLPPIDVRSANELPKLKRRNAVHEYLTSVKRHC